MKSFLIALLPFSFYFIPVCMGQGHNCITKNDQSGMISGSATRSTTSECWMIEVPENMCVRLDITQLSLNNAYKCTGAYLKITVLETNETYIYCPEDSSYQTKITALSDVIVDFSHVATGDRYSSSFSLRYHAENAVIAVKGVNASRESTRSMLLKNRQSAGWIRNTHRAITALFLGQVASFQGQNLEEELMVKQLELQTSVALLRNSTDPLSVSELSMFVNGLSVACHDPRRFYGHDLVKILRERVSIEKSPSPGAYLTLCASKWTLLRKEVFSLFQLLCKNSTYPFDLDIQAVTVMALTCVKNLQKETFARYHRDVNTYNAAVEKFIAGQLPDGSFGNVYTTALITQALIASGQENNPKWKVTSTVQYLMKQLNSSSVDSLSAYLTLPIFSGRSLVDIADVNCANISRRQDEGNEISGVTNKLGGKIRVQYSLYVGDQKDVIHSIYLRLPEQSSAYDIMRVAQVADPKYRFRQRDVSGHMYIYEIAGIINDPEAGKFWFMYSENSNRTVEHYTESPDKFIIDDEGHLIMWYRTAPI